MKKLLVVFLAVFMALTVCGTDTETEESYIPAIFLGFDDGTLPAGFKPNANMKLIDGDTSYINDGILRATATTDPYAEYSTEFFYNDYSEIRIRMKHNTPDSTTGFTQIFFKGTLADGTSFSYSQSYSIKQTIGESSDDYVTYVLKLDGLASLEGSVINAMRFDFISHPGEMYVDYIMVVPKNENSDIVYTFDGSYSPWAKNNGVDALTLNDGILSGNTTAHNGLISNSSHKYLGAVYPTVYVRMMIDKETVGEDGINGVSGSKNSLFYTNLVDADGNTVKELYSQTENYKYAAAKVAEADNGKYKVYTYDFSGYNVYLDNYVTSIAYNVVEAAGVRFNIDTILFKNPSSLEWSFECKDVYEGWSPSDSDFAVENGKLKYTHNSEKWADPKITMSGLSLNADGIAGLEVVMKHEITSDKTSSDVRLYYTGTAADGSEISLSEAHKTSKTLSGKSSGENYVYYYLDLENASGWAGSTINYLRLDPINDFGNVEIESIRFVPVKKGVALDESLMSLSYVFENDSKGHADGTVTLDFGEQDANSAKRINLYWASGNSTDGYTALADYTVLKSDTGIAFRQPIVINKDLLIPEDASALVAKISDGVKNFELIYEIPEEKLPESFGVPVYTAHFSSDFHLGGWGSNPNPNVKQAAARTDILESGAEFLVVSGDICQWYGEISKSDEWQFATEYFKEFNIPVYMVKGNHDEPNYPSGYVMNAGYKNFSYDFFDAFLHDWIKYSQEAGYYSVDRVPGEDYYHTEINGHHYIFLSVPDLGYYAFGDKQLEWFENILYENEESGKPIFVFGHVPANGKLNFQIGSGKGTIADFARFEEILNRHPTAIYTSGDSHYTLNTFLPNVVDGKQETPSYMNDGAVIEAVISANESVPGSALVAVEGTHSMGVVAEIYEDRVLFKARDFINKKWISLGLSQVTFKEKCPIPEFTVKDENGILTVENPAENITYTWYLNGEEAASGTTLTLEKDYSGFVAVRATDSDGSYRSELIETYVKKPAEAAVLHVSDTHITAENITKSGSVCAVSYSGGRMLDVKLIPVTEDTVISLEETGLDVADADIVKAFFIEKSPLKPLGFSAIRYMK